MKKLTKKRNVHKKTRKNTTSRRVRVYRKRREIHIIPGAGGVPLFSKPNKTNFSSGDNVYGTRDFPIKMIPGLRDR
jgi:hypothetical protein